MVHASISSLTRFATDIAATRRGWVQPMRPCLQYPSSYKNCVSCVVFPEPVSPTTTITECNRLVLELFCDHCHFTLVVPNDPHQFFTTSKGRKIFSLFFQSTGLCKGTGGGLSFHVCRKLRIAFNVAFALFSFLPWIVSKSLTCYEAAVSISPYSQLQHPRLLRP